MLPMDTVYLIGSFLPWRYRIQPITKVWLCFFLHDRRLKRIRLKRWQTKLLLYTYLKLDIVQYSWRKFAKKQLQLKRRRRHWNSNILSWKAAVTHYMTHKRCQSCGNTTQSLVFDTYLCNVCRRSSRKTQAYMITTGHAQYLGLGKKELANIPFYVGRMRCKLRFKIEIDKALSSVV